MITYDIAFQRVFFSMYIYIKFIYLIIMVTIMMIMVMTNDYYYISMIY